MNSNDPLRKKSKYSPPNKRVLGSKSKPRSQFSPYDRRSISKEQIRHIIKKVVGEDRQQKQSKNQFEASLKLGQGMPNIRTSLTPKNYSCPKKIIDRQIHSTKAANDGSKPLFRNDKKDNSARYDLKQLFQSKNSQQRQEVRKEQELHRRNKQYKQYYSGKSNHKKINNYLESTIHQDSTLKINQAFNVKAYLTPQEYAKFGERFPQKMKRIGLLGRGGFSVVWLAAHRGSKKKVAVKQILTRNPHETHLKQIWFGSYFFEKGGEPRQQFQGHIGINNLCRLYSYQIHSLDSWLYYQVCEQSLGSCIFQLKGETINSQRIYKIQYKQLILRMRDNPHELQTLIVQVAKALLLINSHNIVHSDLKTENILIRTRRREEKNESNNYIRSVKLIDFGSSFLFTNLKQFSMATPQYMPPQILNYILYQNKLEYDEDMLGDMEKYKQPWVIDVWSLGCVVLQIISGVPLWMSINTRLPNQKLITGLFAVKNRVFSKIIAKQLQIVRTLDHYLDFQNHSGIIVTHTVRRILKQMLELCPEKRISPYNILKELGVSCEPERIPSY